MVGKKFQVYSVQITGKYTLWNSLPMIISPPHVEQSPYKFSPQNLSPHEKHFLEKSPPFPHFRGKETPWKGLQK